MDHLACFTGGMFGMAHGLEQGHRNEEIAKGLVETCSESYFQTQTGIAPEVFIVSKGKVTPKVSHNIQRPETVESIMILYRLTGDEKYRDMGWKIFQAWEKHSKVDGGYAGIRNVNQLPVQHDHRMQSFFLAETFKYLFLLFSDTDVIPLDKYMFNTEAHPLPIPPADFWERSNFECTFPLSDTTLSHDCSSRTPEKQARQRVSSASHLPVNNNHKILDFKSSELSERLAEIQGSLDRISGLQGKDRERSSRRDRSSRERRHRGL